MLIGCVECAKHVLNSVTGVLWGRPRFCQLVQEADCPARFIFYVWQVTQLPDLSEAEMLLWLDMMQTE